MHYPGVSWSETKSRWISRIYVKEHRQNLGSFIDWFDAVCARKAGENELEPILKAERSVRCYQYDLRPCPYCGDDIPNISKKGNKLKKGHYDQRATCGKNECYRASLKRTGPAFKFVIDGPMDRFLYT